jgi:transcriptional regulator
MYKLPYFTEKDPVKMLAFMRQYPFAFVSGVSRDQVPVATQLPLFVDERDGKYWLSGHLMKNTDHHKAFVDNPNALVVFTGPHCYVSASWYADKKQASTWNYMSVQARGIIRFADEKALREILQRTTDYFEANPNSGSNYHDLSEEYINRLIPAIVAFEIEVTQLDATFKLSQNRDEKSFQQIMEKLKEQGGDAEKVAEEMGKLIR